MKAIAVWGSTLGVMTLTVGTICAQQSSQMPQSPHDAGKIAKTVECTMTTGGWCVVKLRYPTGEIVYSAVSFETGKPKTLFWTQE